ncbi:MAG: hypothetical protein WBV94_04525 [Blastocatellia bacterium]
MELTPLTHQLDIGYKDSKNNVHRQVTFGARVNGEKLFAIDEDPQANSKTQYQLLLLRASITEFGTLTMPVTLAVLLALDSIDIDDLNEAFITFSNNHIGARKVEFLPENKVKLPLGYERNGLTYDVVEFGTRLTGMDDVEADHLNLTGARRLCFLAGKQVVRLSQSDGASILEGPLPLQICERLDVVDIYAIKAGSEFFRQSLRIKGRENGAVGTDSNSASVS